MHTILLADDEEVMRLLVRTTLEDDARFKIIEVSDGASALAAARAERPDLLILDWMMPGMTGPEVATAVRDDAQLAQTPIIFLTAKGQAGDQDRVAHLRALKYLIKPFRPLELLETVESALR